MNQIEEQKPKKIYIPTSSFIKGNTLFEQVYKNDKVYYLGWDKQKQITIPINDYPYNDIVYKPIYDELLRKKAVLLPSDAIDYKNEEDLELEISCFIKTWLDITEEHLKKATWYVMLSWITDKLHTIPYLRALGDYGTGKTRYLDVIGGVCYKPMFVGGAVSSAPIYRIIDKWRGTLILDEFTLQQTDETQDLVQILNCGFQRGKPVLRCEQGSYQVKAFDPFGPKVIATRNKFYDRALESRCITEIMQQTDRNDIPVDFTDEFYNKRKELQNKLLMYRFKNWDEIKPDESIHIDFGDILPRIKQSLTPFTVLFQYNQERLIEFINYARLYNNKVIQDNADSFEGQIFNAYLQLLNEHEIEQQTLDDYHEPTITSTQIRDILLDNGYNADKLTTSSIGRKLKLLGFISKNKTISGKSIKILEIDENTLKRLRKRYTITAITAITAITELTSNNNNTNTTGVS